jgi:hypothetical protein
VGFGAGLGGLLPLPPPDGFPVVLGAFDGLVPFAIKYCFSNRIYKQFLALVGVPHQQRR